MRSASILEYAAAASATYWPLAAVWHVVLTAAVVLVVARGPSSQIVLPLLPLLAASVGVVSAAAGNPFNAVTFAVLAALTVRPPDPGRGRAASRWRRAAGAGLIAFALVYPHFHDGWWWMLLYAAPVGVIPCPTLAAMAGLLLLTTPPGDRHLSRPVALFALAYGAIGIGYLGVGIDVVLLAAAALLIAPVHPVPSRTAGTASAPPPYSAG